MVNCTEDIFNWMSKMCFCNLNFSAYENYFPEKAEGSLPSGSNNKHKNSFQMSNAINFWLKQKYVLFGKLSKKDSLSASQLKLKEGNILFFHLRKKYITFYFSSFSIQFLERNSKKQNKVERVSRTKKGNKQKILHFHI